VRERRVGEKGDKGERGERERERGKKLLHQISENLAKIIPKMKFF